MTDSVHLIFIGFNILVKVSCKADNNNFKNEPVSADTDMVTHISCIPRERKVSDLSK